MHRTKLSWRFVAIAALLGAVSVWSTSAAAQTINGAASAVNATVFGAPTLLGTLSQTTTTLAGTGTLSDVNGALDAGAGSGNVPSILTAETLNAGTISWPDQVDSVASAGNVNLTVGGISISADSVLAKASQVLGSTGSSSSVIDNLSINGVAIPVSGAPNQAVSVPGAQVVLNEQTVSQTGAVVVNAVHVVVNGVADVVIASATAGIS